ncbi:MAG: hypothetical protein LBK66_05125 [Spirochaetaceae bacterium]|nr:hypothetical protein [Spirochaetaceae bacterium]
MEQAQTIDAIIVETGKGSKTLIDKLIGGSVQIFDTLVPINDNTFAVTNVDKKKAGLVA